MFEQTFVDGTGKTQQELDGDALLLVADDSFSCILILIPLI